MKIGHRTRFNGTYYSIYAIPLVDKFEKLITGTNVSLLKHVSNQMVGQNVTPLLLK